MRFEVGTWPSPVVEAVREGVRHARPRNFLFGQPIRRTAVAFGVVLTLAACSTIDSMFEGEPPPPTARTSGGAAPAQSGTAGDSKDFPKLSTVPARPERPTPPPQQGLAADRQGARYADGEVQPVNEAADAVVGQRLGASTPPAAAPTAVPTAAPTVAPSTPAEQPAAAPAAPVQSAPPTPMQESAVPQPSAAPAPQAPVTQASVSPVPPAQPPVAQAPAAPMPAPVASTLPPPPAPSQQALILPPTTRPAVSAVTAGHAPATAPAPVYSGNNIQVAVVQFGRASSGLSSDDLAVLRDVAEIQRKQGGTIRIVGHASQDVSGSDAQRLQQGNYSVSLARANAIAGQLVRLGVPRSAVAVEAAGDAQPEFEPVTAVAVASNRRAEIFLAF